MVAAALQPSHWRRPVRAELRRSIRQALGGAVVAVLVTATLTGIGLVYQAWYWLIELGEQQVVGRVLAVSLVREIAPLLVGFILLGRSGAVTALELGAMQADDEVRALAAQGIDPFRLLVMPRGIAFSAAAFTLGVLFVAVALVGGYATATATGVVAVSLPEFLDAVLRAMTPSDFVVFPIKLLLIGIAVAVTACLTGLGARPEDSASALLPRAFIRGTLAVLLCNFLLTILA
jgi:phospholipid/cholesterol/gamma-HCH transport system permease protein